LSGPKRAKVGAEHVRSARSVQTSTFSAIATHRRLQFLGIGLNFVDFGVPQKRCNGSQVARAPIDEGRLCRRANAFQQARIQPIPAAQPDNRRDIADGQAAPWACTAVKRRIARLLAGCPSGVIDGLAGRPVSSNLTGRPFFFWRTLLYRPHTLLRPRPSTFRPHHFRSHDACCRIAMFNKAPDHDPPFDLELRPNGPDVLGTEWWLRNERSFLIPRYSPGLLLVRAWKHLIYS